MKNNWFNETNTQPLIVAHRGASGYEPENTLAAVHLAADQQADGIEFDVQLTADGVPVLFHDFTVDRMTDGSGLITSKTLAELKELQVGGTEKIATLDELFAMFGDHFLYNLELKIMGWWHNATLESAVVDIIAKHNIAQNVLISSFSAIALHRTQRVLKEPIPLAMIRSPGIQSWSYHIFSGQADHPDRVMVDANYMAWAKQRGYRVHVWTVDDPAEGQKLAKLGVHGLVTNKPDVIHEAIQNL